MRQLDQLTNSPIANTIVHKLPTPLAAHKPTPAQTLQVHGNPRLRGTNERHQLAHVPLTLQEQEQDRQPRGIAHTGKDPGEQLDLTGFERGRPYLDEWKDVIHSYTSIIS